LNFMGVLGEVEELPGPTCGRSKAGLMNHTRFH
jgi:hypothetical protein